MPTLCKFDLMHQSWFAKMQIRKGKLDEVKGGAGSPRIDEENGILSYRSERMQTVANYSHLELAMQAQYFFCEHFGVGGTINQQSEQPLPVWDAYVYAADKDTSLRGLLISSNMGLKPVAL